MAKADREAGKQVLIVNMKKNKKFQKDQLITEGYTEIKECYSDNLESIRRDVELNSEQRENNRYEYKERGKNNGRINERLKKKPQMCRT